MTDPNHIINTLITVQTRMSMNPYAITRESFKPAIVGIVAFLRKLVLIMA